MAAGKQTLRQKMINMMYLVLLAILALNVSAEVLKAFYMMEVSMQRTGQNIDAKNNLILNSIGQLMKTQPGRTKEWKEKAEQGGKITGEFVTYIETLKKSLADLNGGRVKDDDGKETEIRDSDNTEHHANYLLNDGKALELKQKINDARDKLIGLVPTEDRRNIKTDLFTPDEGLIKWENHTFEGVPIAAVMATLTKLQNDCKNTYSDVLQVIYSKIGGDPLPIDSLEAQINPKSNFVMAGDKFEASVFLSAFDSKQNAEVVINGKTYPLENGKLKYEATANSQGEQVVQGVIKVKERDGEKQYPFKTKYNVFSGFASVSPDNMNVMYIGLENPISVSVPGVPTDRMIVTIKNGTLTKVRDNKFIARVQERGEAVIVVSVRDDEGNVKPFGQYPFRVKNIPGAIPKLGILNPGPQSKAALSAQRSLNAVPAFDIGFPGVNYSITSFSYLVTSRGNVIGPVKVTGGLIPQALKDAINGAKSKDMVVFTEIVANGPVGRIQVPTDIVYTIK